MAVGGEVIAGENLSVGEMSQAIGVEVTAGSNMSVGKLSVAVRRDVTNVKKGTNMSVGELSVATGGEVRARENMSVGELSLAIGGEVTAGAFRSKMKSLLCKSTLIFFLGGSEKELGDQLYFFGGTPSGPFPHT